MNIGIITTPNIKGQIVIPKAMRDSLKINKEVLLNLVLRGGGIYIYPINGILTKTGAENSYAKILAKTQGAWYDDDWPKTAKKRRIIEMRAAKKRKKPW